MRNLPEKPHSFNHRFILGGLPRCYRGKGYRSYCQQLCQWHPGGVESQPHRANEWAPRIGGFFRTVVREGPLRRALSMKLWLHVRNSKDDDLNVNLYIWDTKNRFHFVRFEGVEGWPGAAISCNFREPLLIFQTSSYQMRMVISPDFTYYYTSGHGSFLLPFFVQEWDLDRFGFDDLGHILLLVKCFCNLHVGSLSRQMATSTLCPPLCVSCSTAGTAGALRVIWFALWVVLTYCRLLYWTIKFWSCRHHLLWQLP